MTHAQKQSFEKFSAVSRPATVFPCLLLILAFPFGCETMAVLNRPRPAAVSAAAPVVRAASDVRAHWIKPGEPAPFDGVLLSPGAYSGLREKITRLQGEIADCRNRGSR